MPLQYLRGIGATEHLHTLDLSPAMLVILYKRVSELKIAGISPLICQHELTEGRPYLAAQQHWLWRL